MTHRNLKSLFFIGAFFLALALYWPSINGTPIWDDQSFWFNDPVMSPDFSYLTIWKNFAWPFSVSFQKFTLSLFGKKYYVYHLINIILHFLNALLVYKLGRLLRIKYPKFLFTLFLLHPSAVITTAWMVQVKTLLCFFFGLLALLNYFKIKRQNKYAFVSYLCFGLSILSKSASLPLATVFIFFHYRLFQFRRLILLLPIFLMTGFSTYKVLSSSVTYEGTKKAEVVTQIKSEPHESPVQEGPKEEAPVATEPSPEISSEPADENKNFNYLKFDAHLIAQTMNYYFWQGLVPFNNVPIKGLNYNRASAVEVIHIAFLIVIFIIFWKKKELFYLLSAHILLLPFLGIIPAPFMNITWVSDQHLYLALPPLLLFWLSLAEKIRLKITYILPLIFTFIFAYQTYNATPQYKDQVVFYEKSLDYNPLNVPIIYNQAYYFLHIGEWGLAYTLLQSAYQLSLEEPTMRKNIYYPYIMQLYFSLRKTLDQQ